MAFLCFALGNSNMDLVKIKEGQEWEIDKYTTKFENSMEIRKKHSKEYDAFCQQYSSPGSVRFFREKEDEIKEWRVLYRKHLVAFSKIVENPSFMGEFVRRKPNFFSEYDRRVILYYRKQMGSHMRKYCRDKKKTDEKLFGMKQGGPRYFEFVREVIFHYSLYLSSHPKAPTIEEIYRQEEMKKRALKKPRATYRPPTIETAYPTALYHLAPQLDSSLGDIDPDILLYDQMDRVEVEPDSLDLFLGSPNFETRYAEVLENQNFFLLGDRASSKEKEEEYRHWYQICEDSFTGKVIAPIIGVHASQISQFESANHCLFLLWEKNREVEKQIAIALYNHADVALIIYQKELVSYYQKKFPKATIIFGEEKERKEGFNDFMIALYNQEYGKKYRLH